MQVVYPVGADTAAGVTALPSQPAGSGPPMILGTPLPTAYLAIFDGSGTGEFTSVQEPPGSPHIEKAEQCTCEHTLKMSWAKAIFYWANFGRGTVVTDTDMNIWRILSNDITRQDEITGILHYTMESISFDSPPDDFEIIDLSLDLNIIKHPRYWWALSPYITDNSTYTLVGDTQIFYTDIKESIIRMIQTYIDSPFYPSATQIQGLFQSNVLSMISLPKGSANGIYQCHYPNNKYNPALKTVGAVSWDGKNNDIPTDNCVYFAIPVPVNFNNASDPITIALAAAKELISKLWRQEDTPYIAGYEIQWTQYFFQPVYLNPGGYVEDPRLWVPEYFLNPETNGQTIPRGKQNVKTPVGTGYGNNDQDAAIEEGAATIFDYLTKINPQCYSVTGLNGGALAFSSLRKADSYRYSRTWFAVTHHWIIAPIGKWDSDIYTQNNRPQVATDYNQQPNSFGA